MVRLLVLLIRLYRFTVSPFIGQVCRFHPSCSRYAEGCLLTHGLLPGSWLALKRLGKCHPFHPGGHDPVPPKGFCNATPSTRGAESQAPPKFQELPSSLGAVSVSGHQ